MTSEHHPGESCTGDCVFGTGERRHLCGKMHTVGGVCILPLDHEPLTREDAERQIQHHEERVAVLETLADVVGQSAPSWMVERDRKIRARCSTAQQRAEMTDQEFWADVDRSLGLLFPDLHYTGPFSVEEEPPWGEHDVSLNAEPCVVCGSMQACSYDAEGRALIHASTPEESDDEPDG